MKILLSRVVLAVASACMGEDRQTWSRAMEAEYQVAAAQGEALSFAAGCLLAAWRDMLASAQGRFVLTSYAAALFIMVPMAAIEIGCAIFGLPYLYTEQRGLAGAVLIGGSHEALLRETYLSAVPALAFAQLVAGVGHLRLAWSLVDRDWAAALRWSMWTLAGLTTLVIVMGVFFLDSRQALMQCGIVVVELATVLFMIGRHAQLQPLAKLDVPD